MVPFQRGLHVGRYGHLFDTLTPTPVEWTEDLLWPAGTEWLDESLSSGGNLVAESGGNEGDSRATEEKGPSPQTPVISDLGALAANRE